MGPSTSRQTDVDNFLEEIKTLELPNAANFDEIILKASKLKTIHCLQNSTIVKCFNLQPGNIQKLCEKSVDALLVTDNPDQPKGGLHTIAKVLPSLFAGVGDPSKLTFIFSGSNPLANHLYTTLKSIIFAPNIFNPPSQSVINEWSWNEHDFMLENLRIDLIDLFYIAYAGKYFFKHYPQTQQELTNYALFEPNVAIHFTTSIIAGLVNKRFAVKALPFLALASLQDPEIRKAIPHTEALTHCTAILYSEIERINSIISLHSSIETIKIDVVVLICIILLNEPMSQINSHNLTVAILRELQLANELKKYNTMHRLTLTVLQCITADEARCQSLTQPLTESLGTQFHFHSNSIIIAVFEACVISLGFAEARPYALTVIHNIAPYLTPVDEIAPICWSRAISILKDDQEHIEPLFIALERYVTGYGDLVVKKALLQKAMQTVASQDGSDIADRLRKILDKTETASDFPLVISETKPHLEWINDIVLLLYGKRHKATYGSLMPS